MQKMPKAQAYPVTLFQRFQMQPLCKWAPGLGVSFDTRAGDTSKVRQLWRRKSPSQPGVPSESCGDERGKAGIG